MAKRKNSTALFEVIRQVEPYGKTRSKPRENKVAGPSLLDRAKVWLQGKLEVTKSRGNSTATKATPESMAANPIVNKSPIGKIVSRGNGNSGAVSRQPANPRGTVATTTSGAFSNSATQAGLISGNNLAARAESSDRFHNGSNSVETAIEEQAAPRNPYPSPANESAIAPLLSQAKQLNLRSDPTMADESDDAQAVMSDQDHYENDPSSEQEDHSDDSKPEVYDDVTTRRARAPMAVAVDSHRKKISLHMTYKAALASAAVLLLVLALAIVIGQKITKNGSPLLSKITTDKLKKGPAHPEVLDPPRRGFSGTDNSIPPRLPLTAKDKDQSDLKKPDKNVLPPQLGNGASNGNAPEKAQFTPPSTEDGKRYIGYNYAIIQSYPVGEEKMAREAAVFLNREGVRCTIENGVKGYQQIAIVGLDGFPRVSASDWIAYKQKIQQLSAKYTLDKKGFKAFTPVPKKWDRVE